MKNKKWLLAFALVAVLALILVLTMNPNKTEVKQDEKSYSPTADKYNAPNAIEWEGNRYVQNKNLTTVMLIGVDDSGPVEASDVFYNFGQADFLMLAVIDKSENEIRFLHINRDTMSMVPMLGLGGKYVGEEEMQIALSHNYGTGLEDSCENTVNAISTLLLGTEIDYYFAMNMDGVAILNDEVGGVTVTIVDEFWENSEFAMGETITLKGSQALEYVRGRISVADGTNVNRMARQKEYIKGFMKAFNSNNQNADFVTKCFRTISDYSVTDMTFEKLSEIAGLMDSCELEGIYGIEGEFNYDSEFVEFYPDHKALTKTVIDLLYLPES